ncbi:hypothetical protein QKW52_23170 [Bacillus sonorensis]|nr:hypothetical protein [Bacillus sonorensis]
MIRIEEKNKFFGRISGFVVHFDTKAELHIHSNDVTVHWDDKESAFRTGTYRIPLDVNHQYLPA